MSAKPVMVVHSTEGTTVGGAVATMRANRSECHEVVNPYTGEEVPLTPWAAPARSLRHPRGTPETNNRGFTQATSAMGKVYQIEVVGKAQAITDGDYPDSWYRWLANYLTKRCTDLGVPLEFPYQFGGDEGYGTSGKYRMSWAQWNNAQGIVGHSHVPGNSHWDPGNLSKVVEIMTGGLVEQPSQGVAMPARVDLPGNRDATIRRIQVAAGVDVDGDPYRVTAEAVEAMALQLKQGAGDVRVDELEAEVARLKGVLAEGRGILGDAWVQFRTEVEQTLTHLR